MPSSPLTVYEVTILDSEAEAGATTATYTVGAYGLKAAKAAVEAYELAQMRLGGPREVIAVRDAGPASLVRMHRTNSLVPKEKIAAMRRELADTLGIE